MKLDLNSLDDLACAVMMCRPDGTVMYKNKMAMKEIRLPKRYTHVQPHLGAMELVKYEEMARHKKACLIAVDTGDVNAKAFVTDYVRRGEPCTLWVFVPYIQIPASSKYIYGFEDDISVLADDICAIIKCIDEKDSIPGTKGKGVIDRKINNKVDKIIAYLFFGDCDARLPIDKAMNLLANATQQTFARFGYDIRYSFDTDSVSGLEFIDMRSFSLFYFHMLTFFAECGVDKHLMADFRVCDGELKIKLTFTMPYPPFYASSESDVMTLSRLSSKNVIDIKIFQRFAEVHGYRFRYSINDNYVDNVTVSITAPLVSRITFHDSGAMDEMEYYFLGSDLVLTFYHMLRTRTFDPDTVSLN